MLQSETVNWMMEAIAKASRSAKFSAAGTLPLVDPGLKVDCVGPIVLPLKPKVAKQLVDVCKVAPYGKGSKTLTDRNVRNSYELSPSKFQLSDDWIQSIENATREVATQLGLPEDQLQAKPYKLLLYERGGFFLPHRDSEKLGRMIGSMVIVLPTSFSGGELVVRHESSQQTFSFPEASNGEAANYVAFYADCEHEIRRVTRGRRIALTYNLTLKKPRKSKTRSSDSPDSASDLLAKSIRSWITARHGEPLVFALEHQYTERGLAVDLLKGADRSVAKLVLAAAEQSGCRAHLAQVSRHLLQFADDGSFDQGRYWNYRRVDIDDLTIGEAYEDELVGDCWKNALGKRQRFGPLPLDTTAIVSSVPMDDWKPTSEDYEGYTGNAGNTLDRWYHRSAIVVWHHDDHFDVLACGGARQSIEIFLSMMSKIEKTPKKRIEAARDDCLRLAKAIIRCWPKRPSRSYWSSNRDDESWLGDFAKEVLKLDDESILRDLFSTVAHRDKRTGLNQVILKACRKHGINVFATELEQLITICGEHDSEIALRDIQWLSTVCCDRGLGSHIELLHRLCSLATDRFCDSYVQAKKQLFHQDTKARIKALPLLVKSLIATKADPLLAKLINAVQSAPWSFSLEEARIPCLKTLVPWSTKRAAGLHPKLGSWLAEVRDELKSETREKPSPPNDWARPAKVECNCRFCVQLNQFLLDPALKETRLAAREDRRDHVVHGIRQYRCDVSHKLEKKRSPYSLVLTKTTASHERSLKQYATNLKLLKSLESLDR